MKAADITEGRIVFAILRDHHKRGYPAASLWDIHAEMPQFPEKVVRAKLAQMLKHAVPLITGCACGCRGDFDLTEKGRQFAIEARRIINAHITEQVLGELSKAPVRRDEP